MRRKLMPHALAEAAALENQPRSAGTSSAASRSPGVRLAQWPEGGASAAQRVEALLDWLEAQRYLSTERFAESRTHARASRYGNVRIRHELRQHGAALSAEAAQALNESELERARAVRLRKFPEPACTSTEQAKQARFLSARGFSADVVRRVVRESMREPVRRPLPDD